MRASLIEQYGPFKRVNFRKNLFAFSLYRITGLTIFGPTCRGNLVEAKFPLPRKSFRVSIERIVDPGRLTISNGD